MRCHPHMSDANLRRRFYQFGGREGPVRDAGVCGYLQQQLRFDVDLGARFLLGAFVLGVLS